MEKFTTLEGVAAPLKIINVDTDMVIPKQYLKTIKRTGLGKGLFSEQRYKDDGSENPDFILNKPAYRNAKVLVAGDNFGCGSSREHAPWALLDFGIRCVISTSFGDIFYNNCFKNGILPIRVTQDDLDKLFDDAERGANATLTIDLERHGAAVGPADFLLAEIDGQCRIGAAFGIVEQFVEVVLGDADRQNAVLEAVVVEDIAERGRDHAADAEIQQRPWRVFAARTAAKIIAGDQNFGVAIGRLVEDEIRVLAAVVLVALFREQPLAKAGALDGFEILLGDDHVGIDIDDLQRRRDAFQRGELVHRSHFLA